MIQPTAFLTSTASTLTLAPVATGELPAFDLSLAMLPDVTLPSVQPLAATGKALPLVALAGGLPPVALASGAGVPPIDLAAPATPAALPSKGQSFTAEAPRLPADAVPAVAVSKVPPAERLTPAAAVTGETATPDPAPAPLAPPVDPALLRAQPARRLAVHRELQPKGGAVGIDDHLPANVPDGRLARHELESTPTNDAPALDQAPVSHVEAPLQSPALPLPDAMATASAPVIPPGTATSEISVTEPAPPQPARADRVAELPVETPSRPARHEATLDKGQRPAPETPPGVDPGPLAPDPELALPLAVVVPHETPAPPPVDAPLPVHAPPAVHASPIVDAPLEREVSAPTSAPVATRPAPTPASPSVPDASPPAVQDRPVIAELAADPRTIQSDRTVGHKPAGVERERPRGFQTDPAMPDQGAADTAYVTPAVEAQPPVMRARDRVVPGSAAAPPLAPAILATPDPVEPSSVAVATPAAAGPVPAEPTLATPPSTIRADAPVASPIAAATSQSTLLPAATPALPGARQVDLTTPPAAAPLIETIRPVAPSPERAAPAIAAPTRAASVPPTPVSPRAELSSAVPIEPGTLVVATPAPIVVPPPPAPPPLAANAPTTVAPTPVETASPLPSPSPEAAPVKLRPGGVIEAPTRAADIAARIALPVSAAPLLVAGTTAPAFRLFAAAIHAARADESDRVASAAAPVASVDQPRPILAVAGADGAPLDMTDRRWPHAMVERIERLQEQASATRDAASTSIRLVPDALGTIDVAVRRDGDTVRVHFAAENAQTRTLIAEAQPRLQELAEAKGIRLAQANVGAGTDGQAQRQPAPQTPTRSAPARVARDDEPTAETTDRVA